MKEIKRYYVKKKLLKCVLLLLWALIIVGIFVTPDVIGIVLLVLGCFLTVGYGVCLCVIVDGYKKTFLYDLDVARFYDIISSIYHDAKRYRENYNSTYFFAVIASDNYDYFFHKWGKNPAVAKSQIPHLLSLKMEYYFKIRDVDNFSASYTKWNQYFLSRKSRNIPENQNAYLQVLKSMLEDNYQEAILYSNTYDSYGIPYNEIRKAYLRGICYCEIGDNEKALNEFNFVVEKGKDLPMATESKGYLQKLSNSSDKITGFEDEDVN